MTIHHMGCGCKLTEAQLEVRGPRQARVCPLHKITTKYRMIICDKCGQSVKTSKCGIITRFCPDCRVLHARELRKIREAR